MFGLRGCELPELIVDPVQKSGFYTDFMQWKMGR